MVSQGNKGHAKLFHAVVHRDGSAVALAANAVECRQIKHAGSNRVNMKVASHERIMVVAYEQPVKRSQNVGLMCRRNSLSTEGL